MNTYSIGNLVRLTATFRDSSGTLVDPDEVVCTILDPSGLLSLTQPLVKDSVGIYHNDVETTISGIYSYVFNGTGAVVEAAGENTFRVRASAFGTQPAVPTPALRTVFIESDEKVNKTFTKDPNATLDYRFDWSAWLAGDEISAATWGGSTGIVLSEKTVGLATCTVFVSGGKAGKTYLVRSRIETGDGRFNDQTIKIEVKDV